MKKLIYTGVIALGLGLMSFKSGPTPSECFFSADALVTAEAAIYGSNYYNDYLSFQAYYNTCMER